MSVCLSVVFKINNRFDGNAKKILISFQDILEQKIAAIASLGATFTAFATREDGSNNVGGAPANNTSASSSSSSSWPFVTLNNFQQRAASAKSLSSAYFLELLPIVSEENREQWEQYSVANKGWLNEGREYQERFNLGAVSGGGDDRQRVLQEEEEATTASNVHDTVEQRILQLSEGDQVTGKDAVLSFTAGDSSISDKIFTFDETFAIVPDLNPGPYFPIWQSSPVLPEPRDLVNYNLITYGGYGPYIELASRTGQIAIGGLDVAAEGGITHPDLTTSFFAHILSFAEGKYVNYTGDPMSSVYVPVVDTFDSENRNTVGILVAIIKWATYFERILPLNSDPVIVVLENTCDGAHTYEVSGGVDTDGNDSVIYLGQGNYADPKYEQMKQTVNLDSTFVAEETTIALTLNQDLCQYSISVYPSHEMDSHYRTMFPLYITIVIGAVFVFTAGAFLMYDRMVERRQKVVLNTAQRSTAIVTSMFPKQVVGKLMSAPVQGNATKLRSLLQGDGEIYSGGDYKNKTANASGIIADLFASATCFFGDVEGK